MLQRHRQQPNAGITSSRSRAAVDGPSNYIRKIETSGELYKHWIGKIFVDDKKIFMNDTHISSGYISRSLYPDIYRILYVYFGTVKSVPSKAYEAYRVNLYIDVNTLQILDVRCY